MMICAICAALAITELYTPSRCRTYMVGNSRAEDSESPSNLAKAGRTGGLRRYLLAWREYQRGRLF
jgi:hypothetical protein